MVQIDEKTRAFLQDHRVAHLATAGSDARPVVVPICYVFDGQNIYSPLDEKPKSIEVRSLGRVRNIEANPQISIVIDDYSEDWNQLAYVLISGVARVLEPGDDEGEHARAVLLLREKYSQYRSMAVDACPMLRICPSGIKVWQSARSAE